MSTTDPEDQPPAEHTVDVDRDAAPADQLEQGSPIRQTGTDSIDLDAEASIADLAEQAIPAGDADDRDEWPD